ncbi:PfkB family carbohydrate kinase [Pontivivens ytuae]|uniref:Sugar kinase n=1 Tax=Pontivivens ytuae TaxID=2789856 RepID=A0A7S9LPV3_9RHOB|nr:PfkB family carbohydrate kinase [Pontivivens ytuae]QPH53101.1 sugar kinase [Pontivivens ytuae]
MMQILVAGQAVVDFIFEVDTLPTEPEKYRARGARIVGGGCAANAAVAISRLDGRAHLAARLAEDPVGQLIIAELQRERVGTYLTTKIQGASSSYSSVYIDRAGERQIMNFRGDGLPDEPDWSLPAIDAALADTRWAEGAIAAMKAARDADVPGVMDAEAPVVREALEIASHVAFSRQGLDEFLPDGTVEERLELAASLLGGWVCVTDGAQGVTWRQGDEGGHVPAFEVDVVDTLGAGDVWHGAFTLALAEGRGELAAMRFANAAAAIKCTRPGGRAGSPTRDETDSFLQENLHAIDAR